MSRSRRQRLLMKIDQFHRRIENNKAKDLLIKVKKTMTMIGARREKKLKNKVLVLKRNDL